MAESESSSDNTRVEIEILRNRLEEAEETNRWLTWTLAATLCFTFYVLWRFS